MFIIPGHKTAKKQEAYMTKKTLPFKNYGLAKSFLFGGIGSERLGLGLIKKIKYQKILRNLRSDPRLMYLGMGIGVIVLSRFAYRYYKEHPESAQFMRDQFQRLEKRLKGINDLKTSLEV